MRAELIVESGARTGARFVLNLHQRTIIGRSPDAGITLDDDRTSRRHVELDLRSEGVFVTDLNSRNGTYVNSKRLPIRRPQLVTQGDVLDVGGHRIRITLHDMTPEARRNLPTAKHVDPLLPLDEFEVLGEIGRGAAGRVVAARQSLMNRTVAVKILREEASKDHATRERFLREGPLACRIRSPYVVEVYDVRMHQGRAFIIMEYVQGTSLRALLQGGPLPIQRALQVTHDVAMGLEAVHAAGVIHRDIKPANIMINTQGRAKLSDFGIAKDLSSAEALTATGEGLGTLWYVSPEQATGARDVDQRTDLYSLGATLYHAVAGVPPFKPKNARVLIAISQEEPQPITQLRRDCPPSLAALIHAMLHKDAELRPESALLVGERAKVLLEELG